MEDLEEEHASPWCDDEPGYARALAHERHMFAWILRTYGGLAAPEAEAEALRAYPYEPASDPCRGFVFHDEAWHWAMLTIHGAMYWHRDRALETPTADYRAEAERFARAARASGT